MHIVTKHISRPVGQQPSTKVARALLLKVRDVGGDANGIAARAGLALDTTGALQPGWKGPLSADQFTHIYRECSAVLEEHDSRRQGRPPMTKGEVDMLCYCVITCATLAEAIERASVFCTMLGNRASELSIRVSGRQAEFRMHTFRRKRDIAAFLSDLTGLSTYHRLFSWLIGEDIEPLAVEMCYPPLIEEDVVARLLPHTIAYNRADNLLHFPAKYLDRPVVRSYAELVDLLKAFPFDLEATRSKRLGMSEKVRTILGSALAMRATLPTSDMIARQFSISGATLKRRLAEEGTSMLHLKEHCRYDLGRNLLADSALSLGDIAQQLGFSDGTTFSRAFKVWSGLSPSAYRQQLAQTAASNP